MEVFSDYVDTDICTEKWYLSTTAIACVEMKIKLRRKRLTEDTNHDIELNYSYAYDMTAIIGRSQDVDTDDDSAAVDPIKFENPAVDF